ncbi:MAG: hypothetical protein COB98_00965 [Flavobacteriaceae bacterium]|nr:MAG: hypothetical protein COB98_00965 [Flavobacteriaceae bacterium]
MLKAIKTLLKDNALVIALLCTVTILVGSLASINTLVATIPVKLSDKSLHAMAYFLLALCWFFAMHNSRRIRVSLPVVAFSVIAFGMIVEALQGGLTSYREADVYDILANSIGVFLAYLLFKLVLKNKQY